MAPRAAFWLGPAAGPLVFHFVDLQTTRRTIRILGSYSEEALARRVDHNHHGPFEIIEAECWGRTFYIALGRGFEVLHGEKARRSPGSPARYLAKWEQREQEHGVLVQLLAEGQETSCHAHRKKRELFWRVLRFPVIKLGHPDKDGRREVELRESYSVQPGEFHQLVGPGLTIIDIFGPDPLGMSDYIRP